MKSNQNYTKTLRCLSKVIKDNDNNKAEVILHKTQLRQRLKFEITQSRKRTSKQLSKNMRCAYDDKYMVNSDDDIGDIIIKCRWHDIIVRNELNNSSYIAVCNCNTCRLEQDDDYIDELFNELYFNDDWW